MASCLASRRRQLLAGALAATLSVPGVAAGAGFAIQEQSGRALGTAFIGEEAGAFDASTIFFNPAGLTLLDGTQVAAAGHAIWPHVDFEDRGSTLNPIVGGGRLRGTTDDVAATLGLVPTFYLAHELTDRIHVGLGVTAPFGLRTDHDRRWVGRYHAVLSDLRTVDFAPTVAVRLTDWLSVGAGVDVQYADAELTNMVDLGTVCAIFAPQQGVPPAACGAVGLRPQAVDGFARLQGDSWGVGFNAGLLLEASPRTRVGFSYRSRIDHTLEGDAEFAVPRRAALLQTTGALVDTMGSADLDLPDIYRVGVFHQLSPRWAVVTGFTWTSWSRFDELVFDFRNPAQPTLVQPERWDDSFRAGLGALFTPTERWTLRGGFAYDESPIAGPALRTPRIPDSDRYWLSAGIGYRVTDALTFDVGYAHLFSPSVEISNPDAVTGHVLRGEYDASADVFGIQLTVGIF
jgi:long-chain fatty acid transport protein